MSAKTYFAVALIAFPLMGCAVGRDEIKLASAPMSPKTQMADNGRNVYIRSMTDARV